MTLNASRGCGRYGGLKLHAKILLLMGTITAAWLVPSRAADSVTKGGSSSQLIFEDRYFKVVSPDRPLNSREDGGHLIVKKKWR
jgi:hypothetical protein